jgi:hypothetical protein
VSVGVIPLAHDLSIPFVTIHIVAENRGRCHEHETHTKGDCQHRPDADGNTDSCDEHYKGDVRNVGDHCKRREMPDRCLGIEGEEDESCDTTRLTCHQGYGSRNDTTTVGRHLSVKKPGYCDLTFIILRTSRATEDAGPFSP